MLTSCRNRRFFLLTACHGGLRRSSAWRCFRSERCPICRRVAPAVEHVGSDPLLAVSVFDETTDAEVLREATVPGSP